MKRNPALVVLCLLNGLFVIAEAMLVPIYALFAQGVGASVFIIGALASTLLVSRIVFTLVVRSSRDNSAHEFRFFLLGLLFRAFGWGLLLFVSSVAGLFIVQIVLGIGASFGSPAFSALFAKHLKNGRVLGAYADWEIISALGAAIGATLGGYLAATYGFDALFIMMTALAFASFAGAYQMRKTFLKT